MNDVNSTHGTDTSIDANPLAALPPDSARVVDAGHFALDDHPPEIAQHGR